MRNHPNDTCPSDDTSELTAELERLREEVKRLSELVSTDPLTNLFNYRHFSHTLDQEIERSQRTLQPTTLIMLDVDHFKKVNDQWGHEVGNDALQLISRCIVDNIRKLDIACRYGGEEFAIILPSSDVAASVHVAERIRAAIEHTHLDIPQANGSVEQLKLTASAGLSVYSGNQILTGQQLVKAADEKLYQAKKQGRNRICFTPPETVDQQVTSEEKSALFTLFDPDAP